MKGKRFALIARTLAIYITGGGIWILLFDNIINKYVTNLVYRSVIRPYEDWTFIFISAFFLSLVLKHELETHEVTEQKYRNIFEHAIEGIFQSTLDGHFISVNPTMAHQYGYDSAEEMIRSIKDIGSQLYVYPQARENFVNELLVKGSIEKSENLHYRKDGSIFWTSASARIVRDRDGNPLYLDGFATDITSQKKFQAALEEAESRYRSLVEEVPAAVYTQDLEDNLNSGIYISPQVEMISGYSAAEWMETYGFWPGIIHPEDRKMYIGENDRTNKTHETFDLEYRIIARDGRIVWLRDISRVARDEGGRPLHWQGILLDITERKLAEKKMEASEERYRTLIEEASDGIFISDVEGNYKEVNSSGCAMLGYDREEILNMNMRDLLPPEEMRTHPLQPLELKNTKALITQRNLRKKDGSLLAVEVNAKSLADGQMLGIVRDITERVQAEEVRAQEQKRFQSLIENSMDAIGLYSANGVVLYQSPAIKRILGYDPEEVSGLQIENYLHPDDLQHTLQELAKILQSPSEVITREVRARHKDGSYRWLEVIFSNRLNDRGINAVVANYRDITERKSTEGALEASEEQYRNLVEHSPYAVAVHNQGMLVYLNQAGIRLAGAKSAEELYGTPILDFVHPESRASALNRLQELNMGKELTPIEQKFLRQDGSTVEVEVIAYPFKYQDKPAVQVVIRDLTEQKRVERAMRASEERFGKAFHASPIPTCITSLSDGLFIDVNEAYLKLTKWKYGEVVGHSVEELGIYQPGDREEFLNRLVNRQITQGEEEKFVGSGGHLLDVAAFYELIEISGQICILSMFHDMTEQKRSQEALRSNEERLRAIVDHTRNIYFSHTPDHMLTYMSEQTRAILGYEPQEALKNWRDFLTGHPVNQRGLMLAQKAIDTGEAQDPYVLELKTRDGRRVWVEVRETPVVRDGKTVSMVGALTDITERKEAEERMERQLAELTVLHAVTTAGSQSNSEDEVIEKSTQIIGGMLYPDNCGILLLNPEGTMLKPHSSYRGSPAEDLKNGFPLSVGVTGRVAASGISARIDDVRTEPAFIETTSGIHSELSVPIRVNQKIIGVLNAESRKFRAFDEEDERLLTTVAGTLGTALERIRLFKVEQKQRQNAEHVSEVTFALTSTLEPNKLYVIILDSIQKLVPYKSASIELLLDDGWFEIVAERCLPGSISHIGRRHENSLEIWGNLENIRLPIIIPDVNKDDRFKKYKGTEYIRCWMAIPMFARDRVIGFINLDSDTAGFYTEEHAALAQTVGNQAAIAIENALLYKSEQRRYQEAEKLRQAATAVTSSLNLKEVLGLLLNTLKDVVPFDTASIILPEDDRVRIVATNGFPDEIQIVDTTYPANDLLFDRIIATRQSLIIEDVQLDSRFKKWPASDLIHGWMGVPMIARGQVIGFITLDSFTSGAFNPGDAELAQSFAHQASVAIENTRLFENLQKTNLELSQAYDTTLEGWGKALELRDKETQGHTLRVTNLTIKLARRMGCTLEQLVQIRRGVLVHDIGKMGVPDQILNKKGPLTKKEWDEMHKHPQHAFDLLYPIAYLRPALDVAYCHHERWDGTGYPRGLRDTQIPLAARIFAVVDVWDALLYERPYRKAWTRKRTIRHIQDQSGTHFDPQVVKIFLQMIQEESIK